MSRMKYADLHTKYKGKCIALGKAEARIEQLILDVTRAPSRQEYNELTDRLTAKVNELNELNVRYRQRGVDLDEADMLLDRGEKLVAEGDLIIAGQGKQVAALNTEISDLHKQIVAITLDLGKSDEHWRELAEFNALNTGQLINTLKTMHTAAAYINDKYKVK